MLKIVNFISGSGSTNLAVIRAERPGGKLYGLVETVAIVSSNPAAAGIQKAKEEEFPSRHIRVVPSSGKEFASQLLKILEEYQPDYFHQLGWMPLTPSEVIGRYKGLNQHLGPGGKGMRGVRRIYAHRRFCEIIGEQRPIPIFCQRVTSKFDEGDVVCLHYEDILPNETPEQAAKRLLVIEHQVQIEALYLLAMGLVKTQPVPKLALNPEEERILLAAKKEARNKYPSLGR